MSTPVFIDSVHAAEMLHVSPETILDWIAAGRLRTFGGRPSNPFVRSAEVSALAAEAGVGAAEEVPGKRVKSASARVQTRLAADARWAEVSEEDIRDWAKRADAARRQAGRKVAEEAIRRLEAVIEEVDEEGGGVSEGGVEGSWRLTKEEQERGLAALEELRRLRAEDLKRRGGEFYPNSGELIHRMREERTRELMQAPEE